MRNFERNFRKFTGMMPLAWLEQQRDKASET